MPAREVCAPAQTTADWSAMPRPGASAHHQRRQTRGSTNQLKPAPQNTVCATKAAVMK